MIDYPELFTLVQKYSYMMGIYKESDVDILKALQCVYDDGKKGTEDVGCTTLEYAGVSLDMPNRLYSAFKATYVTAQFCIRAYLNPQLLLECLECDFEYAGYKAYHSTFTLMLYDFVVTKLERNNSLNLHNDLYIRLLVTGFKHEDLASMLINPEQIDVLLGCIDLDGLVKQLNDIKASPNDSDYYKNSLKVRTAQLDTAREQVKWLNELKNYLTLGRGTGTQSIESKLSRRFQ